MSSPQYTGLLIIMLGDMEKKREKKYALCVLGVWVRDLRFEEFGAPVYVQFARRYGQLPGILYSDYIFNFICNSVTCSVGSTIYSLPILSYPPANSQLRACSNSCFFLFACS